MKKPKKYESNPFSLTFSGIDRFVRYAKSVFVLLVLFSVFSGISNVVDTFNFLSQENNPASRSTSENLETRINDDPSAILFIAGTAIIMFTLLILFLTLFNTIYSGTIAAATNSAMKEKEISLWEAIRQMRSRFGVLYLALLMATVKIIGGLLLFIFPGIRAALRYSALPYIIMSEKNIGSDSSVEKCKALYKGHLMEVFGILTVGGLIPFVGTSLQACGLSLSQSQLKTHKGKTPKTHWLNYIGIFILIGFIISAGIVGHTIFSFTQ